MAATAFALVHSHVLPERRRHLLPVFASIACGTEGRERSKSFCDGQTCHGGSLYFSSFSEGGYDGAGDYLGFATEGDQERAILQVSYIDGW